MAGTGHSLASLPRNTMSIPMTTGEWGYSSDNNATPSISQYTDDAAGLMTALGYDSMYVYGVSMGSSISQQPVVDHPERVRKLVLDSTSYSIRIPETKKLLGIIEAVDVDPTQSQGIREEAQANLAWNGTYDSLSGIRKDVMLVVVPQTF